MINLVYVKDGQLVKKEIDDIKRLLYIEFSSETGENSVQIYCREPHEYLSIHTDMELIVEPKAANSVAVFSQPPK